MPVKKIPLHFYIPNLGYFSSLIEGHLAFIFDSFIDLFFGGTES